MSRALASKQAVVADAEGWLRFLTAPTADGVDPHMRDAFAQRGTVEPSDVDDARRAVSNARRRLRYAAQRRPSLVGGDR